MAFAPSTTCASSCPVARNIAATTLATWALNPRLAAFAEPTRFLRVLSSRRPSGVVCRRSSTTSRGIRTSAVTLRPRALDGVDGGGLLVGTEVARGRRGRRPSRLRRRRRRPRWRWWPCSSSRVLGVVAESQVHRVADDVRRHVEEFAVVRRLLRGLLQRREVVAGPRGRAPRPRQRRRRGTPARRSSRT